MVILRFGVFNICFVDLLDKWSKGIDLIELGLFDMIKGMVEVCVGL